MPPKTKSENEFPLAVKVGSSVVKVYRDRKRSGDYFRLVYYLGGKRQRLNFRSLDDAKEEASAKAAQLARGDVDAVHLTGRDRLTYGRALEAIRSTGVTLDVAANEYAQATKKLAGHSLLDAVNFYMRHGVNGVSGRMVTDAIDDFRQAKVLAGRSAVYLKDIRYRLGGFAKAFNLEVRELVAQDVADYLEGLKLHSRSFNNHLSMLRTFFHFCQARGWLSTHVNLLSRVERRSATGADIEIFTPEELRALLTASPPHVATCLAIQAFAGIRTAELLRLMWHDLNRRPGYIEISANQAKTAARRLISISENLADWLRVAPRNGTERLWTRSSNRYFEAQKLAAMKAGVCMESQRAKALLHFLPGCANKGHRRRRARSWQFAENGLRALSRALYRSRSS